MPTILCIDLSNNYGSTVAQMAKESRLEAKICGSAQEGLDCLASDEAYELMVVVNSVNDDGTGVKLIRSTRLLASRATMPIIWIMAERDLELAHTALQAGATEIYLQSEISQLGGLMSDLSKPLPIPIKAGRVLLVEDDEFQAAFVGLLCNTLGFAVDQCDSVDAGIALLKEHDYQFAVIDILLVGTQSGLTLVRHIRQSTSPHAQLPIMVISSFNDAARRVEALRLGADDFLSKPFSQEEFVWRLQRIMQDRPDSAIENIHLATPVLPTWKRHGLSLRESEICDELIRGVSDKQIAIDLNISFWTVRTHIGKVFNKLGVINRRELMARYITAQ